MSLGMPFYNNEIHNLCKLFYEKNIIIVAAFDNWGGITYPAAFEEVIGVDASYKCINKRDFVYVENSVVNLKAKGGNQRVAWHNPQYVISSGSSMAAPYVTAEIINHCNSLTPDSIKRHFCEISKHQYCFNANSFATNKRNFFPITNAALFPCNKEVHSLLNFKECLSFQIAGVYDFKYSGQIGIRYSTVTGEEFLIENIDLCNWNSIDTLILGHVLLDNRAYSDNISKLMDLCLENGINVFCFDMKIYQQYKECFEERGLQIFSPGLIGSSNLFNKFGKLYRVERPIIGIFGTSSKQGKFTLQLQLRQVFVKKGYTVGQLGTEPQSLLFNMDECLPFGYNAPFELNERDMIEAVNYVIHEIDLKQPDIILAGCQSGTVPFDYNNAYKITVKQLFFLAGLNPDLAIICVNCYDSINYIRRTIQVVEGYGRCKVVSLAMSPLKIDSRWGQFTDKKIMINREEMDSAIYRLQDEFHLPVIKIGDKGDIDTLYKICIDLLGE
ncbi:MAG: DUF1611 domain-containing protein [Lachnospiraceae bacterium]|nr:DUF1611 domain-containing protein [Lachnospiraceae bacterium]